MMNPLPEHRVNGPGGRTVCALAGLTGLALVVLVLATATRAEGPGDDQAIRNKVQDAVRAIDAVVGRGPFAASWESLEDYRVPTWYLDAKFGIFIHWGAYSVPAFGSEWYPRNMYIKGSNEFKHHVATYGPQSKFGYKDFLPKFGAEKFDADRWAELFEKSGARYVVPVAEHHDGFPMYDCGFTDWSAARMGPKRDVIGELAQAIRKRGLHFCLSSHRAEHWWFFNGGRTFDSDVKDPRNAGLYAPAQPETTPPDRAYLEDWLARTCELVDKYEPDLVWFDWWIEQPAFHPYVRKFAAFYYNRAAQWGRSTVINYKNEAFPQQAAVLDIERGVLGGLRPAFWQTDTSVSKNSWGYIKNQDYRSVNSIVDDLADIVSKNGCLLLNIGPKPDGTIPDPEVKMLLEIGEWLKVNGRAIYATRPWKVYGEGPTAAVEGSFNDVKRTDFTAQDLRFTAKGETLYAIALDWPKDGRVTVKSLAEGSPLTKRRIERVRLLGHDGELKWRRDEHGLTFELPERRPCEHAFAFEIGPVDAARPLGRSLTLGKTARASDVWKDEEKSRADQAVDGKQVTRWASASRDRAWLEVDLGRPMTFDRAWIDEWGPGGRRIKSYELQAKEGDGWKTLVKGTTIGPARLIEFEPATAQVVRLAILDAREPTITEFSLFAPAGEDAR